MPSSFETEFHATREELTSLIADWWDRYPIVVTTFAFPPARMVPVDKTNLREVLARADVNSMVFTEQAVDPSCKQAHDVAASGLSVLWIVLGRLGPTGLTQSSFSSLTVTPTWQKINRELKKVTTAGATLIYENGARPFDRNARFTAGAKALAAAGTPLREHAHAMRFMYMPK